MATGTYLNTVTDLVEGKFEDAQTYAASAWSSASEYLDQLVTLLQDLTVDFIDLDFDIVAINVDQYTPQRPTGIMELLREKIEDEIDAGGTGLDEDTEQAIYDRQEARQELINERVYDEALSYYASLGWDIPPGALEGRLSEARLEQTRASAELSRDVMIKQAELALTNEHFILTTALGFFANETQLYQADIGLAQVQIEAEIKSYEVQQQHETNYLTVQLKEAEINLEALLETYKMQEEAIKAGAQIYAQLAASAMSSVSAATQMSFRGGYNKSYSESVSRSYSESHVYQYSA